ncbi:radial spoke head 10 homolog B [Centroberyx affinis]|uniref:radial spoke head 10 homolog B n=1 Tax=Centroberyx affinis TaxID=166261 RepID=UPI003A5C07C2
MAKGDKKKKAKKKNEKSTPEETESKILASGSASSMLKSPDIDQESEQNTNFTTSFSSQADPVTDQLPETDEIIYELPDLSNIIVQRYEGESCNGQFHGEGVAYFQGGHVYKGMFSEGLMHGHGVYTWADGVKYEGEFVSNVPMGHGRYSWLDGSCYEGDMFNAIRHGTGTYTCADKSVVYRGQWHRGKRHGKGAIYYNQDETSWYKGDWVNNNREGCGVRSYPSGNIYEGEWRNNIRHGEGTMKWLKLGQQYSGTWQNGVQHGRGAHTWFLRRVDGSQYPQRNEYSGDFVEGQRHGQGTFCYASGARYEGEWKNNKKHGQGKYTLKNGHVFEGEFVDDKMTTPNLSGIRSHTPNGGFLKRLSDPSNDSSVLVPDMALDIESLLEKIPKRQRDMERKEVEFVVLRHNAELRSIYSFYSRLGHAHSPDNTFLLSRLQLWRLLKDCNVHHHGITLTQMDRFIREDDLPPEEIHSPFTAMLLRRLLSCLVVVAYHTYHKDMESPKNILAACFSKLMKDNILPNAKNVKGFLFSHPVRALVALNYTERCWEVYQAHCRVSPAPSADRTMTCRHLLWMFKDLSLLDTKLTTARLLEIITAESVDPSNLSYCNLDLEITFLEFFEALLGCAEVQCQQVETPQEGQSQSSPDTEARRDSPVQEASESGLPTPSCPSQSAAAPVNSPISPEVSSPKSVEIGKSREILQLSTSEDMEAQQNLKTVVNIKSQMAEMGSDSATLLSDTGRREVSLQRQSFAGATMVPVLETKLTINPSHLPSTETTEEGGDEGKLAKESELDLWIQRIHQFFSHCFFPAYVHNQLMSRELKEERLRQEAQRRIALAKAQERARLREHWEAEEERRQKEEEEEAAEKSDGQDDEVSCSSPAPLTPVASNTSLSITAAAKSSTGAGSKKKK